MRKSIVVFIGGLVLAGCGGPGGVQGSVQSSILAGVPGGAPLVSGQSPPGTGLVNGRSQPQPLNSLPPGAANLGNGGPTEVQRNYSSWTFVTP